MRPCTLFLSFLFTISQTTNAQSPIIRTPTAQFPHTNTSPLGRPGKRPLTYNKPVEVRYEKNGVGDYEFYSYNNSYCPYILEVNFTELINLRAMNSILPFKDVVPVGTHLLFVLTRENLRESPHFQYHIRYHAGCINQTVDTGYTYLLPVAPGKETQVFEETNIGHQLADESEPKDWYVLGLKMQPGDTVFAARRGVVVSMRDTVNLKDSGYYFTRASNYVEIYHNDCSFATYHVFKENGIFVQPGQQVEAGQPLGIAGGDNFLSGTHVSLSVHYYLEQDILKDGQPTGKKTYWAYIPTQFWIKGVGKTKLLNHNKYISEYPAELITKEMSKKELKKWADSQQAK